MSLAAAAAAVTLEESGYSDAFDKDSPAPSPVPRKSSRPSTTPKPGGLGALMQAASDVHDQDKNFVRTSSLLKEAAAVSEEQELASLKHAAGEASAEVSTIMKSSVLAAQDDVRVSIENIKREEEAITQATDHLAEAARQPRRPSRRTSNVEPAPVVKLTARDVNLQRRRRRRPDVDLSRFDYHETRDGDVKKLPSMQRCILRGDAEGVMDIIVAARDDVGDVLTAVDAHGWNAFHFAASAGDVTIMALLLREWDKVRGGEDNPTTPPLPSPVNAAEKVSGWTPLHISSIGHHLGCVYSLLAAGARINVKDSVGDKPIDVVETEPKGSKEYRRQHRKLVCALSDLTDEESSGDESETSRSNDSRSNSSDDRRRRHREVSPRASKPTRRVSPKRPESSRKVSPKRSGNRAYHRD